MTISDYETTLPRVFYVLDELGPQFDQVMVALCAIEWAVCRLEETGKSLPEIRRTFELIVDAEPIGGSG